MFVYTQDDIYPFSVSLVLVLVLVSNLRQVLLSRGFGISVSITLVRHCSAPTIEIHLCVWRWWHSV
jgi:hypothetical protein